MYLQENHLKFEFTGTTYQVRRVAHGALPGKVLLLGATTGLPWKQEKLI